MNSQPNSLNPDNVILEYKSLVTFYARIYSKYGLSLEDLEQEGMLGILEACKRYDAERDAGFGTYAGHWIKKYILQAISKENKHLFKQADIEESKLVASAPKPVENESLNLNQALPYLEQQILRLSFEQSKTIKEIALQLKLTPEKVRQTKEKALRRLRKDKTACSSIS